MIVMSRLRLILPHGAAFREWPTSLAESKLKVIQFRGGIEILTFDRVVVSDHVQATGKMRSTAGQKKRGEILPEGPSS
jgi:hypothetical protein